LAVSLQTDFTQDDKCAFNSTLITEHYHCSNAVNVVRRGGNEISCCNLDASKRCEIIYNKLKNIALPSFDVEDDLLDMPHGVMVKIQHGGLLGLNSLINNTSENEIDDISKLVLDSENKFSNLNDIPYGLTIDFITSHKIKRRRK